MDFIPFGMEDFASVSGINLKTAKKNVGRSILHREITSGIPVLFPFPLTLVVQADVYAQSYLDNLTF